MFSRLYVNNFSGELFPVTSRPKEEKIHELLTYYILQFMRKVDEVTYKNKTN